MKINSVITICVSLALVLSPSYAQQTCTMDYQCGTIPHGYCSGSVNDCSTTFGGVAVDSSSGNLYYSTSCRNPSSDAYNITIKRVSANGSTPTTVYTEAPLQEGGNVAKVFTVENGLLYVQRVARMPGSLLTTFNLQSGAQQTVTLNPGFFQAQLDIASGASYSCQLDFGTPNNYFIQRYTGVVGQAATTANGVKLYSLGSTQCGPVRRGSGNTLYFTGETYTVTNTQAQQQTTVQYTTTFYKGSVVGSSSLPSASFSVNELVNDFVVDASGAIFFGTDTGLFKRVGETTTTINNEKVTGLAIYNNKIYFNNGYTIRSVSKEGGNTAQVVQPSTGVCTCRPGFTGSDCKTCKDGQEQWSGGFPTCVAVNKAGVPSTCTADYQCGNSPYTVCINSSCQCRQNFTGDKCNQCSAPRSLSFDNGIPVCA